MFENVLATDWARLAALIDADGTISSSVTGGQIYIKVCGTSIDLMVWLKQTFGGEFGFNKYTSTGKMMYVWRPTEPKGKKTGGLGKGITKRAVLDAILPYLVIKRNKAADALKVIELSGSCIEDKMELLLSIQNKKGG